MNADASGSFEHKGTLQNHSGKLTWARQHDTMHYCSASSHVFVTVELTLFHKLTTQSLKLS